LRQALDKFRKRTQTDLLLYLQRLAKLTPVPAYKDKILIPLKDKLLPVDLDAVSFFYTTEKHTEVCLKNGNAYPLSKSLEQICASLNPADFTRANKQFIIARSSVKNITIWFDSRLFVELDLETPERIYVSKNKAAEFKAWMTQ
jgi:DNA-binding LytR/AlgR family response regulator